MSNLITAEHFELTAGTKDYLANSLEKIRVVLGDDAPLSVVVTSQGHEQFSAVFKTRSTGQDLVSHDNGSDLHHSINAAAEHLIRQITQRNHKAISKARRARLHVV